MPSQRIDPLVWGFYGAIAGFVIALICALVGVAMELTSPVAGGFFTGWLAGHLWNWAGQRR